MPFSSVSLLAAGLFFLFIFLQITIDDRNYRPTLCLAGSPELFNLGWPNPDELPGGGMASAWHQGSGK